MECAAPQWEDLKDRLDSRATARCVPDDIRQRAATATGRAFAGADWTEGSTRFRAESYFWAVVRRCSLRRPDAAVVRAGFVLSAVVDDLIESGRSRLDVWDEIQRGWADSTPPEVIESIRCRLCA